MFLLVYFLSTHHRRLLEKQHRKLIDHSVFSSYGSHFPLIAYSEDFHISLIVVKKKRFFPLLLNTYRREFFSSSSFIDTLKAYEYIFIYVCLKLRQEPTQFVLCLHLCFLCLSSRSVIHYFSFVSFFIADDTE